MCRVCVNVMAQYMNWTCDTEVDFHEEQHVNI
jgi:hypothetical protein